MNRDIRPENEKPVLFCQGLRDCKNRPVRHEFVRAEPIGNGSFSMKFVADCCGHERTFGIVDPRQSGKAD